MQSHEEGPLSPRTNGSTERSPETTNSGVLCASATLTNSVSFSDTHKLGHSWHGLQAASADWSHHRQRAKRAWSLLAASLASASATGGQLWPPVRRSIGGGAFVPSQRGGCHEQHICFALPVAQRSCRLDVCPFVLGAPSFTNGPGSTRPPPTSGPASCARLPAKPSHCMVSRRSCFHGPRAVWSANAGGGRVQRYRGLSTCAKHQGMSLPPSKSRERNHGPPMAGWGSQLQGNWDFWTVDSALPLSVSHLSERSWSSTTET